jgi:hypothetical protein
LRKSVSAGSRRATAHIEEAWRHAEMLEMLEEIKRTQEDMAMRRAAIKHTL